MKAIEFCYWLQGIFEILEVKSFNEKATEVIKENLDTVFIGDKNANYPFCNWLQGFFDMMQPTCIMEHQAKTIEEKLYGVFQHVVQIEDIPQSENYNNTMSLHPGEISELVRC